jgi:hypothetical protein
MAKLLHDLAPRAGFRIVAVELSGAGLDQKAVPGG